MQDLQSPQSGILGSEEILSIKEGLADLYLRLGAIEISLSKENIDTLIQDLQTQINILSSRILDLEVPGRKLDNEKHKKNLPGKGKIKRSKSGE